MVLVQILLPVTAGAAGHSDARTAFAQTRAELVDAFGGVTAYSRAPAEGVWTAPDGQREQDSVIMVEVVATAFDRPWWRHYAAALAQRFHQDAIHVRALSVELLDDTAR
jgi:hypothetical protein